MSELVEVNCPVCDADRSRKLFDVKDWAFHCDDRVFSLRRCVDCGCGYLSPRPPEDKMRFYYPPRFYWWAEDSESEIDWQTIIQRRTSQLEAKAAWLGAGEGRRLLDVGTQKGDFLWFMQQRGWMVEGVEWDNAVPNPAGMPIRYGDFTKMDFQPESYDVITFWAVLEHVYRPADFIARAVSLLKPGGKLIGLVTNLNSIQARFLRADDYPRHLSIFTASSIKTLCKKHGLRMERIMTDQRIFGSPLGGVLPYICKRMTGYSAEELFREKKQIEDKNLFWSKWRGQPSAWMLNISRIDKVLSLLSERILDQLGFGHTMTFSATRI
jgi:2-polyprenyl-3-methyl-5-hydroxy-6-metoxy-1,4-benzoquinol methylase